MKAWLLCILLPLAACQPLLAHADAPTPSRPVQTDPFGTRATPAAARAMGARPSDEAIKAAVREILDEMPADAMPAGGTVLGGRAHREFAQRFSEAKKAHCMGPDALKHQPHSITSKTPLGEFVFGVGGLFALPFWGAAIVRGKCDWTR